MADNETNYNEILYNFEIDEDTVWSSHDSDSNLISQRFYEEYSDGTFHAICDIPCYPTGLFLHLDISGNIEGIVRTDLYSYVYQINKNFKIEYYPYYGFLNIFGKITSPGPGAGNDFEMSSTLNIKYVWGSCVPKTYCANGKTIFGYHDFKWKKIDDYDLKEKWYVGDFETYTTEGDKRLSGTGTGIMPARDTTTTVVIDCPADWNGIPSDFSVDCSVISGSASYNGYTFGLKSIIIEFKTSMASMDDRTITFNYKFEYKTKNIPCNELQSISNIIFMDPNLWCFTTRTVNEDQADEDIARYPMYKIADIDGNHQGTYLLNTKNLVGTYDFLSTPGKGYIYTKDETKTYEGFTYGYMSNMPEDNKWPVDDGAVDILSAGDDDNLSYYNHTSSAFYASLISRYGVKGIATKAIIQDSPFATDQEDTTKWLTEGKNEETNLLYKKTSYNLNNPLLLYTNDDKQLKRQMKYSALIDQFHLLIEDTIYRIPLPWHVQLVKKRSVIKSIKTDWYYEFTSSSSTSGNYSANHILNSNQRQLIIDSEATIDEWSLKRSEEEYSVQYFNLSKNIWKYRLTTSIQWGGSFETINWPSGRNTYSISWKLETLDVLFNDFIISFNNHPLYCTSPFNIKHHNPATLYNLGSLKTSNKLSKNLNASISSCLQKQNGVDDYLLFYIGLGISKPGYRVKLNQEINSVPEAPESTNYGKKMIITDNTLEYTKPGTTSRTTLTTETFESAMSQNITPATSWGEAPLNGIPLISYWSDSNSTNLDSWDGNNWFFNFNLITHPYGDSIGLDAYAQFFDYDQYPEESIFIYAWPGKKLKTLTQIYTTGFASIHQNPNVDWDTGVKVDPSHFDIKVTSLNGSWPSFEDVVINNSGETYRVTGRFVFNGGGPSDGIAEVEFSYSYYK